MKWLSPQKTKIQPCIFENMWLLVLSCLTRMAHINSPDKLLRNHNILKSLSTIRQSYLSCKKGPNLCNLIACVTARQIITHGFCTNFDVILTISQRQKIPLDFEKSSVVIQMSPISGSFKNIHNSCIASSDQQLKNHCPF